MERGDLSGVAAEDLAQFYIGARADNTLATYNTAFKQVVERSKIIGSSVFCWKEGEVIGLLIQMSKEGTTENSIKSVCAVVNLLFEVMGKESPTKTEMLLKVKKTVIKRANLGQKMKVKKNFMKTEYLKKFISSFYKKPADLVKPCQRRMLVLQMLMFLGIKRFSDIKCLKWGDVRRIEDGSLEIFMRQSKTDQEARGEYFYITGKKIKGVSVPDILQWYSESLGLQEEDFMFPRFRGTGGKVVVIKDKVVAYSTVLAQLKQECQDLGLPTLTLHAGRIGGATGAARNGISRENIKDAGGWRSDAVDTYIRTERPGVVISDKALSML